MGGGDDEPYCDLRGENRQHDVEREIVELRAAREQREARERRAGWRREEYVTR